MPRNAKPQTVHYGVKNKLTRKEHRVFDESGKLVYEGRTERETFMPRGTSKQPRNSPSIADAKRHMRTGR